jgi:hypothetical protein
MNYQQLIERIRNLRSQGAGPGPTCPDDHQIAAAIDGTLKRVDRDAFERHVSDCDACIARIGVLNGLRAVEVMEPVPDITLARAKRIARRARVSRHVPRWATAAVVVLALTFAYDRYSPDDHDPDASVSALPPVATPQADFRPKRNIAPNEFIPKVLTPIEGALIDPGKTLFRWTDISGSLYYDVRVVTWEGDMVWQERVNGTEWWLPDKLELESGAEYYVRVDAYLAEAKNIRSRHVLFKAR